MEYVDLTQEIYHGHEKQYESIIPALSLSDSNSSLPPKWTHSAAHPSLTKYKPLPVPYPRVKNEKLDKSVRNQMNEFAKYMNDEYIIESQNTSNITPYQSPKHNDDDRLSLKHQNRSYNPFCRDNIKSRTQSETIKSNTKSMNASSLENEEDITHNYSPSSRSASSFKLNDNDKYIDLADLSIGFNDENRDNVIKKYVDCFDKAKGTENMIEMYLYRWKQEEMQNIAKIDYCFGGINNTANVIKPLDHKRLLSKKKNNKKKKKKRKKYNKNRNKHNNNNNSLKTIYDRNRSMDLIDNNHIFKYGVNTPSNNGLFGGLKHERNQTMPYRQYNNKNENDLFDSLSYSLSPSPEPRIKYFNYNYVNYVCTPTATNDSSETNTFYNNNNNNNHHIVQPRASIVEKTFSWSDNEK